MDSVFNARVTTATRALIQKRYPPELASVIWDDPKLPAYEEARAECEAILRAIALEDLTGTITELNHQIADLGAKLEDAKYDIEHLVAELEKPIYVKPGFSATNAPRGGYVYDFQDDWEGTTTGHGYSRAYLQAKWANRPTGYV